jgi:hypothetical protein
MKMKRLIVMALVALLLGVATVGAQEPPELLQTMTQLMERDGWTEEQIAEFEEHALAYQWENFQNVEPQALMMALRYAHAFGGPGDELPVAAQVQLTHQLALAAGEMAQLGYTNRDIARLAVEATRESLQTMTRNQFANPDVGVQLQDRLMEALQTQLRTADRIRLRESDPTGPAYRFNEDGTPGVPPGAPEVVGPGPGDGDGDGPDGPKGPQ